MTRNIHEYSWKYHPRDFPEENRTRGCWIIFPVAYQLSYTAETLRDATGAPLLVAGSAPAPVAANLASHQLAASLLSRLSAQDSVMISNFDDLKTVLRSPSPTRAAEGGAGDMRAIVSISLCNLFLASPFPFPLGAGGVFAKVFFEKVSS